MILQSPYQTYKRYRSLQTHRISALPIVILMPHSACNCRCVMCDIWKSNHDLRQLTENDIQDMMATLKKMGTQQVLMSGGEALLNSNFFRFCEILKKESIKISLLSTGLSLQKNAEQLVNWVDDVIVSLDGDETMHNEVRNVPGAFKKMADGINALKKADPRLRVTSRTVIHRLNYALWPAIINSAKAIGIDQVSFLPADVSSHAFNRAQLWSAPRQNEILLSQEDLEKLRTVIRTLFIDHKADFANKFIAETKEKIHNIYFYYASFYGLNEVPFKKCNAPWVSTVVEADGSVRPCFFHEAYGNIKTASLDKIINSPDAIAFRKNLDMAKDETCSKCVCYLNLSPGTVL
jgi:Fe-coproporphyrin III synthase